ncbi:hypothetical protein [Actinoplanes auranticolor]|uniref:Uncharacterized protein n=1 Tax=Actinoplanes auranticolor TaxID=47988 RepID=A0A919S3M5_9ACTN|nr:hypothetical protein [Actinoplanes auranticolor]GIM62864.1 hypothetical protein Aau02nite_00310 [Actinoplanes auranticolor]
MRVIESFVAGKAGNPSLCEDAVIVTQSHAAIVDGATDTTGQGYGVPAVPGGRWAMAACVEAITTLAEDADVETATRHLTSTLAGRIDPALRPHLRPSASVTVYSRRRRQVWQIGDVGFHYAGLAEGAGRPRKPLDRIAADFRAAVIAAELAIREAGELDLAVTDPGRIAARALISRQGALRNTVGPYAFAAIDGRPVPPSLVTVHDVPGHVDELVLASDGYPEIRPTLAETEARLAELLAEDPHCIGPLRGTKGVMAGQISFDDRSYLRLRLS